MTVQQLVARLMAYNQEMEVVVEESNDGFMHDIELVDQKLDTFDNKIVVAIIFSEG